MAGGRAVMLAVLALGACDATHDNHGIRSPDAAVYAFTFEVQVYAPEGSVVTADGEPVTKISSESFTSPSPPTFTTTSTTTPTFTSRRS